MRKILVILILLLACVLPQKTFAQVVLKSDTINLPCNLSTTFLMPIKVRNFTDVSGLQFTFQWNPAQLQYAYITDINPAFDGIAFDSTNLIAQGKFTFAWSQLSSVSLSDDEVVLNVAFTRIGGPATSLDFTDDPTSIFVFDAAFNELDYELESGLVNPLDFAAPDLTCPSDTTVQAVGMVAVNDIAALATDDCGPAELGWTSSGASMYNFPSDPDASGSIFNLGTSVVEYTATDIAGNTSSCSFNVTVEFAIGDDLTFLTDIPSASCGDTISIDITTFNFDTIAAFQFSMGWDPALLSYLSISNLNPTLGLVPADFGTDSTGVGQFSLAWGGPFNGTDLADGSVVFTLNMVVLGSGLLSFGDVPTTRFAFSGAVFPPEEIPIVTVNGSVLVTDTIAPTVTCPGNQFLQAPGPVAVQNIAPVADDNCAPVIVGWTSTGATDFDKPTDPDASGSVFNLGTSLVTYTVTDASGNTDQCAFNITIESMGPDPNTLTLLANNTTTDCDGSFFIDISVFNFTDIAGLQFSLGWDPALVQYDSVSLFNPALNLDPSNFGTGFVNQGQLGFGWTGPFSGTTLMIGENIFRVYFTVLGNVNTPIVFTNMPTDITALAGPNFPPMDVPVDTLNGVVFIADGTPPGITCPSDTIVDAPMGSLMANVTGLDPVTSDNCPTLPMLSYGQTGATGNSGMGNADGDYNSGVTTVTYTAEDGAGNTSTCSFTVTVNADAPIILHLDSVQVDCQASNDTIKYCITVENFTNTIGLQFGLEWDTAVLHLVPPANMAYPGLTINDNMFNGYSTADDGLLLFFGVILTWPDIPTGDTLFCLDFAVADASGSTGLNFQAPLMGVDDSFGSVPVLGENGSFSAAGDNTPPDLTCPASVVLAPQPPDCSGTYMPPMPMATDACGAVDTIFRDPDITNFNTGTTVVTYTAVDEAGNSATCSFDVTVTDTIAPVMSNCPANITVFAPSDACNAPATWTAPDFTDCAPISVANNFFPDDNFPVCSPTTVFYTATDSFGNASTCQFTVTALDTISPTIVCPADTVIFPVASCDTTVFYTTPTATDLCDANVDIMINGPFVSGSVFPAGTTTVTWFALDECSNLSECTFTVTVVDGAPPVINGCPMDTTVYADVMCEAIVNWIEPSASDDCDTMVVLTPTGGTPGGSFPLGDTEITYTASDDSGNLSTCSFTITVLDTLAPQLANCPTGPFIVLLPNSDCDTVLNWTPPTVSDNCGQFTVSSNFDPGDLFTTGDTMVTYVVVDDSGNADSCSFLVSVRDQVPPVLSNCPPNTTVNGNGACKVPVFWTDPTATDNCSVPIISAPVMSGDSFMVGITIVQIIAEDASSNYDTCTFMVTVEGVPPGFDLATVPADISVVACDTLMSWDLPTPTGFCDSVTVTSNPPSPTNFGPGVHVVTFTATDGNNSVTTSFSITVIDEEAPVITCPTDLIEVNTGGIVIAGDGFITGTDTVAGCDGIELFFGFPTATDNCTIPLVTQDSGLVTGAEFSIGSHSLIFVATDDYGNTASCSVTIVVSPLEALNTVVDPDPGCLNEAVLLMAPIIQGATYGWVQLPNTILPSITNQYEIPSLNPQTAGDYAVIASVNGCLTPVDTFTVTLITAPNPMDDVFEIEAGAVDTFNVFLNDGITNPMDYTICSLTPDPLPSGLTDLGNGLFVYQETSGAAVSFVYQICYCGEPGEEATVTITVNNVDCDFIPNTITPNGDGVNDWLVIPCLDSRLYPDNSIVVYNQWGDKVFEDKGYTNDPNDQNHPAWRGTLEGRAGEDLPDGVYYYIFKAGPSEKNQTGFIEILR
ncbi:MAG: HYR domain-containing protein [Lewinellaceae bacterium]|nr:HYR domain-containing protein [Saprospiraceae bacterium]MCB9342428.1 HYR domain-containing protein [Lewinellaceae bacterium]